MKVAEDWRTATLDESEFAILEVSERLTLTPSAVGAADLEPMRAAGLSDDVIFAAILAIGYRNFICRVADMLGVEDDREHTASIEEAFAEIVELRRHDQQESRSDIAGAARKPRSVERLGLTQNGSCFLPSLAGSDLTALLQARPKAAAADKGLRDALAASIPARRLALINVCIAGLLGLDHQVEATRGPLPRELAQSVAAYWPGASLSETEKELLAFVQNGTLAEATISEEDIARLRGVGLADTEILAAAALTSYQNHALRTAQALGVAV